MYILPYHLKKANDNVQILWCFLSSGGKCLWQTEEENPSPEFIVQEYLLPNGFEGSITCVKEDCIFFEVSEPKFSDFYLWTDETNEECWRPFFLVGDTEEWGWMDEAREHTLGIPLSTLFETVRSKQKVL